MVCQRCVMVVRDLLEKTGFPPMVVNLGEIDFGDRTLSPEEISQIGKKIEDCGFELIDDKKSRLVNSIKTHIIELVQNRDDPAPIRISAYLTERLPYEYSYLSNLFSAVEGTTIEQYLIRQKVERIKELLVYDELSLKEISYLLGYSSPAHLSTQFKKVTGLSPSHFSRLKNTKLRKSLDKL